MLLRGLNLLLVCLLLHLPFSAGAVAKDESVLVFAAASLRDAVNAVIDSYEGQRAERVVASYASSSTLARQIAEGAQADIYIAANPQWMDYLAERDSIDQASRRDLLGNGLVLITHKKDPLEAEIAPGFNLRGLLGAGYLAMGDPAHVPAGIYGQVALESLGVWESMQDRVARADNVRAALALVSHRETPLGIVYYSDAVAEDDVRVVDTFPSDSHPPIIYPVARLSNSRHPAAASFFEFLQHEQAATLFQRYGFKVLN